MGPPSQLCRRADSLGDVESDRLVARGGDDGQLEPDQALAVRVDVGLETDALNNVANLRLAPDRRARHKMR